MTINDAIKKANEGGYQGFESPSYVETAHASAFLDPAFWQSLGKAMGWEDERECPLPCCGGICPIDIPMWQSKWHNFIDHLAAGKDAESFFESL